MPTNAFPDDSQLYSWYVFVVIPSISAVLGYVLLRGHVALRLLLLNLAIIGAIASGTSWSLISDPTLPINFPFLRVIAAFLFIVATGLFAALYLVSNLVRHSHRPPQPPPVYPPSLSPPRSLLHATPSTARPNH